MEQADESQKRHTFIQHPNLHIFTYMKGTLLSALTINVLIAYLQFGEYECNFEDAGSQRRCGTMLPPML